MSKLLLVDSLALLYRAHFVFLSHPRYNATGLNTSALYGFTTSLLSALSKLEPSHVAVAVEGEGPAWRETLYADYKAHRERQPEDLEVALERLPDLLAAFGIPVISYPGYEADDVIGTLARRGAEAGMEVYMMTPDKDYAQLVSDRICWYKTGVAGKPDQLLTPAEVLAEWGLSSPGQVCDLLGLAGDSSDNIPGIPGIGPKTARKLIATYGSIEGLLAHREELPPKLQEKVASYGDQALLSRRLATISTDLPLELAWEQMRYRGIDHARFAEVCRELDFKGLAARVAGKAAAGTTPSLFRDEEVVAATPLLPADSFSRLADVPHTYRVLEGEEAWLAFLKKLAGEKAFCLDTETTSLSRQEGRLLGISFSCQAHEACYLPWPQDPARQSTLAEQLSGLLARPAILKVGQNLKYDLHILASHGISVAGPFFDTMVAHHLLQPEGRHGLDSMAEHYLAYKPIPISDLIGTGRQMKSMAAVPLSQLAEYACEDADVTWQLYERFAPALQEEGVERLFAEVEMPLLPILVEMERAGVAIDCEALGKTAQTWQARLGELAEEAYRLSGSQFNLDSPKQLGEVLFTKMQLAKSPRKTRTGQYATSEAVLRQLEGRHPIIEVIRHYRTLKKLLSTYAEALPELVSAQTGCLHTHFHQHIVSSGRLSSSNPNLQNIPIRTEEGQEVRRAFVPRKPGNVLLSADYSQIELRLAAHFSEDEALIGSFLRGEDIHALTAAALYQVSPDQVSAAQRHQGKLLNFSIIYGITPFGLSQRLEISRGQAADFIDAYFAAYPGVKRYIDCSIELARERGYVTTLMGRKRKLPDIHSRNKTLREFAERNAINLPIQGTQAEIIKKAMIQVSQWLAESGLHSYMVLQVHDELLFEVPEGEADSLRAALPELMQAGFSLRVPLVVDIGVGRSWLEAH